MATDLRSDILVPPSDAMLAAMAEAARRPRGYGMREDSDQRDLEALAAELLGQEDALFFPTCTMANQAALMIHCRPGEVVVADTNSHLGGLEASATAGVAGVVVRRLDGIRGHLTAGMVEPALRRSDRDTDRSVALVWLENTHNYAGGTVMPLAEQRCVEAVCRQSGVPVHVDGARIWNAAAALQRPEHELAGGVDSVAVSLNKALGAPLGAVLASSREFISEALRVRQMLGGGWRPTGILAAAAVVALRTMRARLPEDHDVARSLADKLATLPWLKVDPAAVETNIIVVGVRGKSRSVVRALDKLGVRVIPRDSQSLRLVVHAGIRADRIDQVVRAFQAVGPMPP